MASPPLSQISWIVCSPSATRRLAIPTFALARAKVSAVALPMPDEPLVTSATFSSNYLENNTI